ncbi:SAV_2336 N-terminal domain-related protein [Streptomyces sp. NPDC051997]|uniref:SAV_2336 N-terminal domain-related protein n=1 Tax=Streptomyces sp. NPDC051997 TaxID=3155611 RepID=UPI003415B147
MSDPTPCRWLVTSTPQDNRAQRVDLHARAFPPRPVFSAPPDGWPRPTPAFAAPAAASALQALSALDPASHRASTPAIPNIPGASPYPRVRPPAWDLVLVIDTGASMTAWHVSINAFVERAYKLRSFGEVHIVKLHSQGFDPTRELFDTAEVGHAGIGGDRRKKLILVITDAVGPAWNRQPLKDQLSAWAAKHPLAILHVQPYSHWTRSALATRILTLRSAELGGSNASFETQTPDDPSLDALAPADPIAEGSLVIPVMELSKRWIEQWCRLLSSTKRVRQQAIVLGSPARPHDEVPTAASAEDLVVDFLKKALPDTARLVVLLAAAPLNRHIMQLIADVLMPHTGPEHLAEILSSGLLRVVGTQDPGNAPFHQVVFDFLPGVRRELLSRQRDGRKDCVSVAQVVDDYLSDTIPGVEGLAQRIRHLSPPDTVEVNEQNLLYLEVERIIFEARLPGSEKAKIEKMSDSIRQFKHQNHGVR